MARDIDLLLADMLDSAEDALRYAAGLTEGEFRELPVQNRDRYRALKNALSELGEAAKLLPSDVRERHPEVDWRGMAGLRDIVAHQYFRIDMDRLWPVLTDEMPALVAAVRAEILTLGGPLAP